ncbi:hypothetical protein Ciccas_000132 [Cichlidogyrus casuarinus]|uniref:Uncharacterized protein n=1 Tax=Cichlidogyrus casuarinus TaxID=1844966 RepID=A0ABD2QNS8_9PLAT
MKNCINFISGIRFLPTERRPIQFMRLDESRVIQCALGQTLIVTVDLEGLPPPNVTWHLNGIELENFVKNPFRHSYTSEFEDLRSTSWSDYTISNLGRGLHELRIDQVSLHHAGRLKCVASNGFETVSVTWEVMILAPARFLHRGPVDRPRVFSLVHGDNWNLRLPLEIPFANFSNLAPTLGEVIESIWVERFDTNYLSKLLPETPIPGSPQGRSESRMKFNLRGTGRDLLVQLDRVKVEDQGIYRIWIQNRAGKDYYDVELVVEDKPRVKLAAPSIRPHGPGALIIEWDPSSVIYAETPLSHIPFTGYRVEYRREQPIGATQVAERMSGDPDAGWKLLGTTNAETTSLVVSSKLDAGQEYRFRVRLENWLGQGPPSNASSTAQLPNYGTKESK